MARRVWSDRARGAGRRSSSRVAGQPAGGTRAGVIASRVLAVGAVFALTLGCSRSHEGLDAGRPVDASRDVSMPDAFCPDRDGDGFASAACGGQDCDDSRAELSPDATACVGATSFASCEGPEARTQPCPSEAPACDARTGRCSPLDAVCGDGVLHLGEECDDGNDLDEEHTTLESGLGWVTKLDKGDFIGREALAAQKEAGVGRRLVGLRLEGRGFPRPGYEVLSDGEVVGQLTSGTVSPSLGFGVAMGYVRADLSKADTRLQIDVRGKPMDVVVQRPPFYTEGSIRRS